MIQLEALFSCDKVLGSLVKKPLLMGLSLKEKRRSRIDAHWGIKASRDVGIAVGAGTNVAMETADIILVRTDPADIVAMDLSRATYNKMVRNLIGDKSREVVF